MQGGTRQRPRIAAPSGPRLVGRRDEMSLLEDEFSRSAAGEFRLVLLLGEPGVGKSRLSRELLAGHARANCMFARAHPLGSSAAFGLLTEAVDPFLQVLSDEQVTTACSGLLDDLASLFVRVAAIRGGVPQREPPLPRLLQGLSGLLRNLAARAPVLAVLDDVHHADASSWEALRYFARHLDDVPLLVVATSRPAELAGHELANQVLFELDEDGLLSRMQVAPLDRRAISDLAEAVINEPPPAALVGWVEQRSQGNPLYAISLLRALLDERADLSAPHLRRLPEDLTERMAARTRSIEAEPRAVLELLAVIGRPVPLGDLATLTRTPADRLDSILAGLVAGRAVAEGERGRDLSYEVQHPLIRDVLYQGISGARRRMLHRQAARFLLEAGLLAEAAQHFARSADPGDPEAVQVLLDAMRQAERREAFREALDLLAELADLLPPSDPRWLEVLDAMYWRAEWVVDHRADSHAPVAIKALSAMDGLLAGSADAARRATVKFRLANFLAWGTGDLEAAAEASRQASRLFEQAGDHRQALLAARELGWILGLRGDLAGMLETARRVVAEAEASSERFVAMQGLAAIGYSAAFLGRFAEAESAYRRAEEIARADDKAYRLTVALSVRASQLSLQGRIGEALPLFEEAKSVNPGYRSSILVELEACTHWMGGNFPAAVASAQEAAAWVPGGGSRRRALGMACGGMAAVETGDRAEAERLLGRARTALAGRDWSILTQYACYGDAMLARHLGQATECIAMLQQVAARLAEMQARPWNAFVLIDLAEAAAELGDAAAAGTAAEQLTELAKTVDRPLHHGLALTAAGWASLAAGQPARAAALAADGIGLVAATGCRAHLGRAHDLLGSSLTASNRTEAVAAFESAATLFGQCGANWRRDRSLDALRRLGGAGRRAAAAALGPGSLTRREREVARLASSGMTARAIAAALFVGERTVESHLASAYAKLGVESKLDLVKRADELGLRT
jgi:DNA-binding CsgD family transcriptional regulator/tetratricopeptide (TPR) repeat protein